MVTKFCQYDSLFSSQKRTNQIEMAEKKKTLISFTTMWKRENSFSVLTLKKQRKKMMMKGDYKIEKQYGFQ